MKNRFVSLVLASVLSVSIVGCGSADELNTLNSVAALNSESSVSSSYNLSWTDEQNMVYAQVSSRQLLDLSTLEACTDNEIQQVVNYMNSVDNQLVGKVDVMNYDNLVTKFIVQDMVEDDAVIDSYMTDYLLSFFEKTPWYWQRTKTIVRGIDPASRAIIVDVQYKTIDFEKEVLPDSTIVLGEPNYTTQLKTRYNKWLAILAMRLNNPNNADLPMLESDFEKYYGDPEDIIESQRVLSNTGAIFETGNQRTYNGVIDSAAEQTGGTCTVRYILIPNYVLGINLGVTCEHMYITEFKLDSDITEGMETFTKEGYATVTDSVYSLIHSYFTCIDESNYDGLYKLTNDFAGLDKHYNDIFDSVYQKHDGFSVSLFDITGTHITCGVTISTKERAKNSNMTFPIYTDKYFMELELIDGVLKVDNMVLLSRVLEGEPAINTDDADISGFSASIDLNNDDKLAVENLICEFSALQLLGDATSDKFSDIVDISISTNQLSALQTNMTSLTGEKKVVFMQNYQQGTSNYASVRCKELFQDSTNAIVEANATYEFILKGGKWYIYNYDVNSSVRLDTTNLNTTGSLCLVSPGKVEAYTSQVKSSISTSLEEVSDTSVAFDHDEYEPVLKSGTSETGYRKLTGSEIDETIFNDVGYSLGFELDYTGFNAYFDELKAFVESKNMPVEDDTAEEGEEESEVDDSSVAYDVDALKAFVLEYMAIAYNMGDNRYSAEELQSMTLQYDIAEQQGLMTDYTSTLSREEAAQFIKVQDMLSALSMRLKN